MTEAEAAREASFARGEIESLARYESAILETYRGSIERARAGATTIISAASAIATVYVGVLSFAQGSHPGTLRLVALVPLILLGGAVVNASGFLTHFSRASGAAGVRVDGALGLQARTFNRIVAFHEWVTAYLAQRVPYLRAAFVALVLGLISMPLPLMLEPGIDAPLEVDWPRPVASLAPELQAIRYEQEVQIAVTAAEVRGQVDTSTRAVEVIAVGAGALITLGLTVWPPLRGRRKTASDA